MCSLSSKVEPAVVQRPYRFHHGHVTFRLAVLKIGRSLPEFSRDNAVNFLRKKLGSLVSRP